MDIYQDEKLKNGYKKDKPKFSTGKWSKFLLYIYSGCNEGLAPTKGAKLAQHQPGSYALISCRLGRGSYIYIFIIKLIRFCKKKLIRP